MAAEPTNDQGVLHPGDTRFVVALAALDLFPRQFNDLVDRQAMLIVVLPQLIQGLIHATFVIRTYRWQKFTIGGVIKSQRWVFRLHQQALGQGRPYLFLSPEVGTMFIFLAQSM